MMMVCCDDWEEIRVDGRPEEKAGERWHDADWKVGRGDGERTEGGHARPRGTVFLDVPGSAKERQTG